MARLQTERALSSLRTRRFCVKRFAILLTNSQIHINTYTPHALCSILHTTGLKQFGPVLIAHTQLKVRANTNISDFMIIDTPGMIDR
jgi:hypothetical protein